MAEKTPDQIRYEYLQQQARNQADAQVDNVTEPTDSTDFNLSKLHPLNRPVDPNYDFPSNNIGMDGRMGVAPGPVVEIDMAITQIDLRNLIQQENQRGQNVGSQRTQGTMVTVQGEGQRASQLGRQGGITGTARTVEDTVVLGKAKSSLFQQIFTRYGAKVIADLRRRAATLGVAVETLFQRFLNSNADAVHDSFSESSGYTASLADEGMNRLVDASSFGDLIGVPFEEEEPTRGAGYPEPDYGSDVGGWREYTEAQWNGNALIDSDSAAYSSDHYASLRGDPIWLTKETTGIGTNYKNADGEIIGATVNDYFLYEGKYYREEDLEKLVTEGQMTRDDMQELIEKTGDGAPLSQAIIHLLSEGKSMTNVGDIRADYKAMILEQQGDFVPESGDSGLEQAIRKAFEREGVENMFQYMRKHAEDFSIDMEFEDFQDSDGDFNIDDIEEFFDDEDAGEIGDLDRDQYEKLKEALLDENCPDYCKELDDVEKGCKYKKKPTAEQCKDCPPSPPNCDLCEPECPECPEPEPGDDPPPLPGDDPEDPDPPPPDPPPGPEDPQFDPGSDRRIKRKIKKIGVSENGYNIYEFKYLWSNKLYQGVIAQELIYTKARCALKRNWLGFYRVNYNRPELDVEFKEIK